MGKRLLSSSAWSSAWILYILECADGTYYTGITSDLPRRLKRHETGKGARYTRGRGPFIVRYTEEHPDRSTASKREWEVKRLPRKEKPFSS